MVTLPANPFCLKNIYKQKISKEMWKCRLKKFLAGNNLAQVANATQRPAIDDDVRLRLFTGIKFCSPQLLIMIRLTEAKLGLICVLIQPYRHLVSRNNV